MVKIVPGYAAMMFEALFNINTLYQVIRVILRISVTFNRRVNKLPVEQNC